MEVKFLIAVVLTDAILSEAYKELVVTIEGISNSLRYGNNHIHAISMPKDLPLST